MWNPRGRRWKDSLLILQSRFNDSERQKAELGDRVSKVTVSDGGGCFIQYIMSPCENLQHVCYFKHLGGNSVFNMWFLALLGGTREHYQPS